jgi:Holliday junction DNA helicase RuvA
LIYKLIGKVEDVLTDTPSNTLGVLCGDIGYAVHVSQKTMAQVQKDKPITLYIEHLFRQDSSQALVGFLHTAEQESFKQLMSVQGVGLRSALSILSFYDPGQLLSLVAAQDVKSLSRADGIGKKTAERILLELKNKFKNMPTIAYGNTINTDALDALEALGFSKADSLKYIQDAPEDLSTEQLIRHVLKRIGS